MKLRTILFAVSACLVLAGAMLYLTKWSVAPYLFAVGSAGIAVNYLTTPIQQLDFRGRLKMTVINKKCRLESRNGG